jgi:putative DNA primase/helicase
MSDLDDFANTSPSGEADYCSAAEAPIEADGISIVDEMIETDEETISRLAKLPPLEYDRSRDLEAKRLGCRVTSLDIVVTKARGEADPATGRGITLRDPEPWPEPVEGGVLLDLLSSAVHRHVVLSDISADAVALWIAHTWVYSRFEHSPRLGITSPLRRCGKSTLMEVLRETCRRPLKADNLSASGVFRTVEALRPLSLLIDEADTFMRDNEELRGVLNSGYERSGQVIRVVERKDEHVPVVFATYCPVALAAIGDLSLTLADRALPIRLQRKAHADRVEKLRASGNRAALTDLRRKLARWAKDCFGDLSNDPPVPEALNDREGDISIPLLAIAAHAGQAWAERGRRALLGIFGLRAETEGNADAGALLLADLHQIFNEHSAERMPSVTICKHLKAMEDRPWPDWKQGKPMTPTQLARELRPFRIQPTTIRNGEKTPKGYHKGAFEEAWSRYLPQSEAHACLGTGGAQSQRRHNPGNSRDSAESVTATSEVVLRQQIVLKPAENLACGGVADEHAPHYRS